MNITRLIAETYAKMISEATPGYLSQKDLEATSTAELRNIANTHSRAVSMVGEKMKKAKEAGDHAEVKKLSDKLDNHLDTEIGIRDILRKRAGLK
jgi:hypothetical protein